MKKPLMFAAVLLASTVQAQITVAYNERPPYLVATRDGSPSGLTGTPAAQAFRAAGIDVRWVRMPTNRQIAMVRENSAQYCAVGWFRNDERAQFAKFTRPIYRDHRWVAMTGLFFDASEGQPLEELMGRGGLRLMVKDKYSYGPRIDAMLSRFHPVTAVSTGSTVQMLQSLSANTVDLMFVSEEEAAYLMSLGGPHAGKLRVLNLAGMPKGEERHIMCSLNVPDELIAKLNREIVFR
jgi:polar amino acid transport system substrate-binding protein